MVAKREREAGDRDRTENIHKHERVRKVFFRLAIEILSSDFLCDTSRHRVDLIGGHGL
jgi:hypothetical protein